MCISWLWLQLCIIICIVSYAAGHGKERVTEVVRVESADSPLSATAMVKAPPRGTGICESLLCHVIMFLLLSCTVEGGSRASRTRTRQVPLQEGVYFCCGCSCVCLYLLLFRMQQSTERSV